MLSARSSLSAGEEEILLDLQDSPTDALHQTISSDGESPDAHEHGLEAYIDIRPTADVPATSLTKFQIAIMIARFMIGANTANMSPPVDLPQPFASAMDWGFTNIGIEAGTSGFKAVSRYWLDSLNALRNEGYGNAALGLLSGTLRVMFATLPSSLIGLGIGALISYYHDEIDTVPALKFLTSTPMARIIAALISPWIYIGTKKLIEKFFPQPEYQYNATPPLHTVQYTAMLAFSIYDAVNIYEFVRILIKAYGPEEILHHPHFAAGVIPLYILLSNVIDPLAFGHSKLYNPPPFEAPVMPEEIGEPNVSHDVLSVEDDFAFEFDTGIDAAYRDQLKSEAREADLKNAAVYAACAILAIGAGLIADLASAKMLGDTTRLSNTARKLGVGLTCAATAVTQLALVNNASTIIDKAKHCWARLFHQENAPAVEVEPLLANATRRPPPPNYKPAPPPIMNMNI